MTQTVNTTSPQLGKWLRWASFGLYNPEKGKLTSAPVHLGNSAGAVVTDARAMQIAAVWSCIRLISETCASLPREVYRRKKSGTREKATDHWLSALIHEPNPMMTSQEYWEVVFMHIASWGNSYNLRDNIRYGERVKYLWPLRPEAMCVERDGFRALRYQYTMAGSGEVKDLAQPDVLHVKGFGSDGVIGLAPLAMARQALGLAVSADDYAGSFFANGGKPSGVLMIDKTLTKEQRQQVRKQFSPMAEGGANKLWVLEAASKYQPISIPPEDAQMLQTRQFQIAEIARFFRVPLFLLMEMEKSTSWGSGLEQQNIAFLTYTLRPYLTRVENSINRWLLTDAERDQYFVEHNVEGLLRADSKARAEFYSTMVQNGLMKRNEVRDKENLPPVEGGDQLTAQTNLAPLDKLGQEDPLDASISRALVPEED